MAITKMLMREFLDTLLDEKFKASEYQVALLIFRLSVLDGKHDWTPAITVAEIASRLDSMGSSTVSTAITNLVHIGLIQKERVGNGANRYRINISAQQPTKDEARKPQRPKRHIHGLSKSRE